MTDSRAIDLVAIGERPKPPGFFSATWRVTRIAPFQILRRRRLLALAFLALVPSIITVLLRIDGETSALGVRGFLDMSKVLFLTAIFPTTLLFLGAAAVGDDIDNGTLLYLRLRPVSRSAIVAGRYLAAVLSAVVVLAPAVVLLYVLQVGHRGASAVREELAILFVMLGNVVLASLAYAALFLLLSLMFRFAVIIGLVFVVGWEVLVSAVIPSKAALMTVSFHLRAIVWNVTTEGREMGRMMRQFEEMGMTPTIGESVAGLLIASLVLIAIACFVFRGKEFMEKPGDA